MPLYVQTLCTCRDCTHAVSRGRESRLIGKIQTALEDIEQGVYGICQVCGKDIGLKRLEARPVTHHCIRCKVALELRERLRG